MKTLIRCQGRRSKSGFSLAEAVISLAVGTLAVTGGMTLNQEQLRLVKSSRESNAASLSMEERIEQLRIATWRQLTDSGYVMNTYFSVRPQSIGALSNASETLKVTAFPDATACDEMIIERKDRSNPVILKSGSGLDAQRLAKVSVQIRWTSKDGRSRLRELATIISNAGISRMNLPAMGTSATTGDAPAQTSGSSSSTGGTTTSTGGTTTSTGGTTTSTGSTTTSTGSTTTSTETTLSGSGRGNVGGKSGKK
jgi:hypothetical protein